MTEQDRPRFTTIYTSLLIGLRPREEQRAGVGVYFSALLDLPIEAVEDAGLACLRELGREWVPTTTEWYAAADELAVTALEMAGGFVPEPDRILAGSAQEKQERMARITVARHKFLEQLGRISSKAVTRFDEGVPLHDPEGYWRRSHCPVCHDHGLIPATPASGQQPSARPCLCIATNPVIKTAAERRKLSRVRPRGPAAA